MKKFTDEEIQRVRTSPGFYWNPQFYNEVADHIRDMQEGVERLRKRFVDNKYFADLSILNNLFWSADDARDDPDDNEIGHEW